MQKPLMKKYMLFVGGLCILTFGARLLLISNVGIGGIDAFAVGLSEKIGLTIGIWIIILSSLLIIVGSYLKKSFKVVKPMITALLIGILFDGWGLILFDALQAPQTKFQMGLVFLMGLLIAPIGTALYIAQEISAGSMDYLMLAIKEHFKWSIQNSRIAIEVFFVVCAIWIQGPIGIGTIVIMISFGPLIQFYSRLLKHLKKNCR